MVPGLPDPATRVLETYLAVLCLSRGYGPLLARAKASRLGDSSVTFSVQGGLAACDLIDAVAESAARLETR